MLEKWYAYLDEREYFLLIISHVLMLVCYPFVAASEMSGIWMSLLITLILVTGLYAAHTRTRFFELATILCVCALLLTWLGNVLHGHVLIDILLNIVGFIFFSLITFNLVRDLHKMEKVTKHMIFGGIAGYLLVGLLGAFVFALIELWVPGSFGGFGAQVGNFPDFIYYSYVSMTTLGFGDVIPVSYHAQSWSILFTIAGQMYLAVLIGMIVGKYVRR